MAALVLAATLGAALPAAAGTPRPRVIVLTDISSLAAGLREPDDGQSLIRLLLYADALEIEGLVASSNLGHGQTVRPELIREALDAYAEDYPRLRRRSRAYPAPGRLRGLVKAGQPVAGPNVPIEASVGEGKDTEASDWILGRLLRPDPRPLWVPAWGGAADLAQALWKLRRTRPPRETAAALARLRVHAVYDQDAAGPWIRREFPEVYFILRSHGVRGMYRAGDTTLVSSAWVAEHIHASGAALGRLYPDYRGGDIWAGRLGPVRGIKEGDTPSFLHLIPNGLNPASAPEWGGWGGRFRREKTPGLLYTDAVDTPAGSAADPDPRLAAVYRWRADFQNDFAARLAWAGSGRGNRPPRPAVGGRRGLGVARLRAAPGARLTLDARASRDPDGDALRFRRRSDPEASGPGAPALALGSAETPVAVVRVPPEAAGRTLHVVLAVTDGGAPALTRYCRILIDVAAGAPGL